MEPIYRTDGEWVGVYHEKNLFNIDGEWLGFVIGRNVFDPGGKYLAYLSNDRRLLRKRHPKNPPANQTPPSRPPRPTMPANMPLAPMLRALPMGTIDMFEEFPQKLLYVSDTRPDMD